MKPLASLLTLAIVSACDAPARPALPVAESPARVEAPPPLEAPAELALDGGPSAARDPFRPLAELEPDGRPSGALSRYELGQLKLTSVITGRGTRVAMVEDPLGLGHTIAAGTPIGRGRVLRIAAGCVEIREESRDPLGRRASRDVALCVEG